MAVSNRRDALFLIALRSVATISAGIVVLVVLFVARESWSAISGGTENSISPSQYYSDETWSPSEQQFNFMPMIVGSLAATFGSLLLTAPLGIGAAVFLNFYAPRKIAWVFRRTIEVLAGVPSVVYGLWGISVLLPLIARFSPLEQGQSLLAGILILTFMTIPTVVIAADAAIKSVPNSQINAAAALGMGRRATVWSIVIPAARLGLISAVVLQVARAIGETMAVVMVCGSIVQVPRSVFEPVITLTANIALEMGYADGELRSVLFLTGLIALLLVAFLMALANTISEREAKRGKLRTVFNKRIS